MCVAQLAQKVEKETGLHEGCHDQAGGRNCQIKAALHAGACGHGAYSIAPKMDTCTSMAGTTQVACRSRGSTQNVSCFQAHRETHNTALQQLPKEHIESILSDCVGANALSMNMDTDWKAEMHPTDNSTCSICGYT